MLPYQMLFWWVMTCVMWLSDTLPGYSMWLPDIFAGLQRCVAVSDAFSGLWPVWCSFQMPLLGYNIMLPYQMLFLTCVVWLSDAFAGLRHGSRGPAALPNDRWSRCCCRQVTPQPAARQACSGCRCVLFSPSRHLEVMLGSWGTRSLHAFIKIWTGNFLNPQSPVQPPC